MAAVSQVPTSDPTDTRSAAGDDERSLQQSKSPFAKIRNDYVKDNQKSQNKEPGPM